MQKPFHELRERLLGAGVAPRHVRRYLAELDDHLADLTAEERKAGRSRAEAETAAVARLGTAQELSAAMIHQRQLQSLAARAPWAVLSLAPVLALGAAYSIALLILWTGWNWFLPDAATPFGGHPGRITAIENIYFQAGKMLYFAAPFFIGWAISLVAARQRANAAWAALGMVLIGWISTAARVYAHRLPGGSPHVGMNLAVPSSGLQSTLLVFSVMAVPYLLWRIGGKLRDRATGKA